MKNSKSFSRIALAILREIPEGNQRIAVTREAQSIASGHIYINVRGEDVIKAVQSLRSNGTLK